MIVIKWNWFLGGSFSNKLKWSCTAGTETQTQYPTDWTTWVKDADRNFNHHNNQSNQCVSLIFATAILDKEIVSGVFLMPWPRNFKHWHDPTNSTPGPSEKVQIAVGVLRNVHMLHFFSKKMDRLPRLHIFSFLRN